MSVKKKKLRFIPRTGDPDNPVDRMRCFNVIQGLKARGYDVGLYQGAEDVEALVTLSLDVARWSDLYERCFQSNVPVILDLAENEFERSAKLTRKKTLTLINTLAAIIHKFGVSVDFLRKFRAESVFRCDYKASKLVEPNRDEARAPSGNSSARRGLYICVGAGSQGTVRWDTDGASVMRRAFVRDKTMPGAPRCDEKFPEPGHRF